LDDPAAGSQLVVQSRTGAILRVECRHNHARTVASKAWISQLNITSEEQRRVGKLNLSGYSGLWPAIFAGLAPAT
jgi:hypothetical protein